MNKAVPWSIKGVGFDAREAAREAARRSGLSLGEWLNNVIAERAAETGMDAGEIDAEMRLEAVAAKLVRMSHKAEEADTSRGAPRTTPRETDAFDEATRPAALRRPALRDDFSRERPVRSRLPGEDASEVARRPAAPFRESEAATPAETGRMLRKSRRLDADTYPQDASPNEYLGRNMVDPEALLNDAIEQFDRRAQDAQKKTASALANVAQWIETSESRRENEQHVLAKVTRKLDEIQHRVASRDEESESFAIDALGKVARRLDNIETRVLQRANEDGGPVRQSLERLESRLEALARRPAPGQPAIESTLRDIDGKIAALNQRIEASAANAKAQARIDALAAAGNDDHKARSAGRMGAAPAKNSFGEAIADIMRRQQTLENASAGSDGRSKDQASFDQRMESIAARLERGGRTVAAPPVALAPERTPDLRLAEIRAERGNADNSPHPSHTQMARLRQEIAELSSSLGNLAPRGSVEALETAMRELSQRIEAARASSSGEALLAPMHGIAGDLRKALSELDPGGNAEKLQRQVQSLHEKLDAMGSRPKDGPAMAGLLEQMQEMRELISRNAAQPLPFETIERQIAALSDRIEKATRASQPMGVVRGQQPDLSGIAENIREIIDRALPRPALQQLGDRLESLDAKLDGAMSRAGADMQMAELSDRMAEVHRALGASRAPAPIVDMRPLEEMMREISSKLDAPRAAELETAAFKSLENQVSNLAARLDAPQPPLSREALEQFENLAHSIDALQSRVASQGRLAGPDSSGMEETLRELARTLENVRKPEAPVQLLQSVEAQLSRVAEKLEHSNQGLWALSSNAGTHFDTLSKRIDAVQSFVSRQMEELNAQRAQDEPGAGLSDLEDMVRSLASKMEAVRGDTHSAKAIENLEVQISRMAERLESSGAGTAAINSLERTVNDLFAQLEDTRHAALDAAETAARTAARDTLREAMQAGAAAAPSPEIAREIAGIKSQQEEAERRTHSTLSKVHDTLERVVDRLASLEDDGESRVETAARTPAPAPKLAAARPVAEMRGAKSLGSPGAASPEIGQAAASKTAPALEEDDFLIEPGLGRNAAKAGKPVSSAPAADGVTAAPGTDESKGNLQTIIAAARRLHQAQAEKSVTEMAAPRARVSSRSQPPAGPLGALKLLNRTGAYVTARKRPLLLMVASLMLVFATVEAIRVFGLGSGGAGRPGQVTSDAKPLAPAPAEAPLAPVQKAAEPPLDPRKGAALPADPAWATLAQKAAPPVDPSPVASIPAAPGSPPLIGKPENASPGASDSALLRLAASGDASAQYEMGLRLGEGRNVPKDMVAAAAWLEKAAAQNLAPAQYRTGSLYEKGIGVARDVSQAKAWYTKAASNGNTRAMHNLAVLTADSGDGKPDYAGAVGWFTKAAEYGVRDSQFNLAVLYARGLGVQQNFVKSYVWFAIAAAQGDTDAAAKKKEVGARLDNKQMEQAQSELAAFRPKTTDVAANDVAIPAEGWDALAQKAAPKPDAGSFIGARPDSKAGPRAKIFGL